MALRLQGRGADGDVAAAGQGVAGIDDQIEDGAFELVGIDLGDGRVIGELQVQGYLFADGALQQFFE